MTEGKFTTLDDVILHLKGLVLVRDLRARSDADDGELRMYSDEIERVREELASVVVRAAS